MFISGTTYVLCTSKPDIYTVFLTSPSFTVYATRQSKIRLYRELKLRQILYAGFISGALQYTLLWLWRGGRTYRASYSLFTALHF